MASTTQDLADVPSKNKRFIPLETHALAENNPETMTALVHKLGLSESISFVDVISIDEPELLDFVPRPTLALLLVFPISDTYEKARHDEDREKAEYCGSGNDEAVVWYKQTIGNACGLIGLLHAVSNGDARTHIKKDSDLSRLLHDAIPLNPFDRANLLYNSDTIEIAHQAAAVEGDTTAPEAAENTDLHYVCFVKSGDHLWELDGRRKGPLERGTLDRDEDVLSHKALDLGVRSFLKREKDSGGGELRFSLIALAPSFD